MRAFNPKEIETIKYSTLQLEGAWGDFLGTVERTGVWIIWGNSGSGKSTFAMQLCRELARHGRVLYNSLEEGISLTMRNRLQLFEMNEVNNRFQIVPGESIAALSKRLSKRRSADFVVIDSLQYAGFKSVIELRKFCAAHRGKLLIFISQASGKLPAKNIGIDLMYAATQKIFVSGYLAVSKGRFFGSKKYFPVWSEMAAKTWGNLDEVDVTAI